MQETNDLNAKIEKLLNQQKIRLQQMLELLQLELDAVKNRDGNKMLEIADKKELQLQSIRKADEALNQQDKAEAIQSTPKFIELKSELTELLSQCQTKNEIVYLTATQNQVAIEQVKSLLLGSSKSTTYDSTGQKKSGSSLGSGVKA